MWLLLVFPGWLAAAAPAGAARPLPVIAGLSPAPDFVEPATPAEQWPEDFELEGGLSWRYWLIDAQIDRRSPQHTTYLDIAFEPVTAERLGDAGR